MNKYINCINYLISKKTNQIPHNNNNLFNHLVNVYNKLRKLLFEFFKYKKI